MSIRQWEKFLKIVNLKLIGNWWHNSYTEPNILDIKPLFTCGESTFYQKVNKIIRKIVGMEEFLTFFVKPLIKKLNWSIYCKTVFVVVAVVVVFFKQLDWLFLF